MPSTSVERYVTLYSKRTTYNVDLIITLCLLCVRFVFVLLVFLLLKYIHSVKVKVRLFVRFFNPNLLFLRTLSLSVYFVQF